MRRRTDVLAVTLALALNVAACAGDGTTSHTTDVGVDADAAADGSDAVTEPDAMDIGVDAPPRDATETDDARDADVVLSDAPDDGASGDVDDGTSSDADVDAGTVESAAARYCADRNRSYCAAIYSDEPCAVAVAEAARYAELFDVWDAEGCVALTTSVCVDSMTSIEVGYLAFDPDAAVECIDMLDTLNCVERLRTGYIDFEECLDVTTGLQDAGEPCRSWRDCADDGQSCVDFRPVDGIVTGVCRARGDIGESCNVDNDCQGELVCDLDVRLCSTEV